MPWSPEKYKLYISSNYIILSYLGNYQVLLHKCIYEHPTRVFQLVRTFSYLNIDLETLPSKPGNQESKIMQHIKKAAAFLQS